jgi:hypothetical protein
LYAPQRHSTVTIIGSSGSSWKSPRRQLPHPKSGFREVAHRLASINDMDRGGFIDDTYEETGALWWRGVRPSS